MLKKTIRSGPRGFPLAAKISEVTPTSEEKRVRCPSRSKTKKNTVIIRSDDSHNAHSKGEKYFKKRFIKIPQKRHPQEYFKDLTYSADAVLLYLHHLPGGSYLLKHYTSFCGDCQGVCTELFKNSVTEQKSIKATL